MERVGRAARPVVAALILAGTSVLVAACGTGVESPGVASIGTTTTTTVRTSNAGSGVNGSNYDAELVYAECMRKSGVPDFPDPSASGGFEMTGVNPRSSVFQSAQKTCGKDLPGGGPMVGGSSTNPSPAAMAAMLKVSECMRSQGVSNFPDPTTHVPTGPPTGVISDRDGVILVLPHSLDMQSSLFQRAAAACNFALSNH